MARVSLDYLKANRPQVDQAKIDATTEADIRRHMVEDGQDPDAEPTGYRLAPDPAKIRDRLGLTQAAFADVLGIPAATLRNWEQRRKLPDPAARSLLTIFDLEPAAAMRALASKALARAVADPTASAGETVPEHEREFTKVRRGRGRPRAPSRQAKFGA